MCSGSGSAAQRMTPSSFRKQSTTAARLYSSIEATIFKPDSSFRRVRLTSSRAKVGSFRRPLRQIAPYLGDRVNESTTGIRSNCSSVQINRLKKWHRPGLLCIGDAAHAMSPAGGVGINLAIQDAVAAANVLARPLREARQRGAPRTDSKAERVSHPSHSIRPGQCTPGNGTRISK